MPIVEVHGRPIAYRREGAGPALVLLHGFLFDSRAWRPQLEDLDRDYTVIAWDAPGAGRSPDPPEGFTIGDWADALTGFLDAIGVARAHVCGLSWGGILAQELYRRHPDRVSALILADTYAGWKGSLPAVTVEERLAGCLRDSLLPPTELVAKYLPGMHSSTAPPEVRDEMAAIMAGFHPVGFRMMATALATSDTRGLLPTIAVPTLLVWGDADARSPMSVADQLRQAIAGSDLVVLPGVGHVSNLEDPPGFDAAVRGFLASLASG
jgi:pimeloyl-ACP methyl ester carboxylesterase